MDHDAARIFFVQARGRTQGRRGALASGDINTHTGLAPGGAASS
jgi:hypothetical protein